MKAHTSNFKEQIKKMGRELDSKITYTLNGVNVELGKEQLNSITPTYQGALLKSVMKELDIDSNVYIPEKTILNYQFGVKVNGEYEYINFGNYVVYKAEKQEDTNSYKLTCYDKMLYSMIDYEKMNITYPITIRNYIKAICDKLGITFANANDTFANYDKQIQNELYLDTNGNSISYTFRDVFDELSQVTASTICLNDNDELEIRYINDTGDTIDEEYLKDVNVNFGEKFGKINSIVLSRSAESDNIYLRDETSVAENGLCEIKIIDNQIMNFNNRDEFLPDIFSKLAGLEYYLNDFSSTGICYYDLCDRYNVKIGDNIYSCVMFNDEILITQGLEENVFTEMPEETQTDYTKADKTDRKINQTYLIVDKQNQKIESVISQTNEQNQKIAQVTQTVEELNSKISDIADITTSAEDTDAKIEINEVNQSEPIRLVIRPIGESISNLVVSSNMLISDNLKLKQRVIRFTNTNTNEIFDYSLPDDLFYYDSENYDEFILDYDGQSCVINKKVGINEDGTVYLLETPTTIEYEFPTGDKAIILTEGDYTVEILGYGTGYIFARLMAKNIYTTQFYTKAEVDSEISQTAQSIDLSVNSKLSNYSTTTEMNSAISLKANEITSSVSSTYATKNELTTAQSTIKQTTDEISAEVSKKVNNTDYTHAKIVAKINDSTSSVLIEANKINLTGYLTISSASNTYASKSSLSSGTTTINGGCITTGTIDASKVTVKNLNADNITSGTLSANKINGGTITASAINLGNGTFSVTTAGKVTATSGSIGGWNIGTSAIEYDATNYKVSIIPGTNANKDFLVVYNKLNNNYPFFVRADGYVLASNINITGGSIGGMSLSGGVLSSDRLSLNATSGILSVFNSNGGSMILSNACRLSATAGVGISANSTGNISAPSSGIDIKGCKGATVYIGCMTDTTGTNEASCVSVENGTVKFRSTNYMFNGYYWDPFSSSSKNMKTNIEDVSQKDKDELYELIKNISIKQYDYKDEYGGQKNNYGFIIEEIEDTKLKTLLHIIQDNKDANKKSYKTEDLARLELVVIQELMKKIERLEEQVNVN